MSTEIILEGVALYANLPPRPAQKGYESEDTSYSVQVEITKEKFAELKKAGIPALTTLKLFPEDYINKKTGVAPECSAAEGKSFIRLRASKYRANTSKGSITFDDIPVVDADGNDVTVSIANGSKVRALANLEEIKGKPGKKALRLKAVVVTDLIPYEGGDNGTASLKALGITTHHKTAHTVEDSTTSESGSDDAFLGA